MKNDAFILHVRLTTKCNADCDYCSAYDPLAGASMPVEDFKKSIIQIRDWISLYNLGGTRRNITVQYLGGEILTISKEKLEECVCFARKILSPLFGSFQDGAQTNLIGSWERVEFLSNLFTPSHIGTSVDSFTDQRKVAGSSQKYRTIMLENQSKFKKNYGAYVPGIVVVDSIGLPYLKREISLAVERGYHLNIRTVFNGGKDISEAPTDKLIPIYTELFNEWILKQRIILQPFYQLLSSRLGETSHEKFSEFYTFNTGCPFQHDCALKSMDLEPNGDIYVCQDMADSRQYKLGNALVGIFDEELFNKLVSRSDHLTYSCQVCEYKNSCQGGCMSEAIHHYGDLFAKTDYCGLWKALFAEIDRAIETHGPEKIAHWLLFLENKYKPVENS